MIRTLGLNHVSLTVRDVERSRRFYETVFGAKVTYREPGWIEVQTPGAQDHITFVEAKAADERRIGTMGGIDHLGFALADPRDIDAAVREVEKAGGKILRRGEFSPGHPYVYVHDPDGYEVEIWYE